MIRRVSPIARLTALALALLAPRALQAVPASQVLADALDTQAGWDVEVDAGADRASSASVNGAAGGSAGLRSGTLSAVRSIPVESSFAVDLGIRSAQTALTASPSLALPSHLNATGLVAGVVWKPASDGGLSVETLPAFSGEGGARGKTLNVSGAITGYWLVAPHVLAEAGVEFDSLGKYPLYPAGGVVVDLSSDWSLRLLFPQSRLVYQITPAWAVYAGATEEVQSFRVGERFGTVRGLARLDNAALSLEETQIGPGTSYQWGPGVYLEANAGFVTDRHFDYFRAGREIDVKNAAAVRLTIEVTF